MKNVYFVQVGFDFGGSVYLPYAAGTMIAKCNTSEEIKKEYAFPDIIYKREKLADALDKLREPYLVAFSCCVWNLEFNKVLAKAVKEKYPECITLFGGHSVENEKFLDEGEFIDMLNFGEGEDTFLALLKGLSAGNIDNVPNIVFRRNGEYIKTERSTSCCDLNECPSPYLTGVFDKIMADAPGTDWLAVLETNRGCPYSCAYCAWTTGRRMRLFPMEKVLAEIDWFAEKKVEYIFCGDSNFGIFDRDIEIAKALVKSKKEKGNPKVFRPCYEKNSADRVFEICRILNSEGMDKGATMAYQTLNDTALENIGRKNLTMEHFSSLLKKYNEAGIPTYSELILGLPGETKESFREGLCNLLEYGQHNSVSVYHCEMLPNSEMSDPAYIEKHGIEVIKVSFNHIHSAINRNEEIQEYSYLVRSTKTMSPEDWVYCNLFSVCLQCFHSLGLLRCFSIYLRYEKNIPYIDFFTSLLEYIMNGSGKMSALWHDFEKKYDSSFSGDWNYHNEAFGNVTWSFEEGAFLEFVNDFDASYEEMIPFLKGFCIDDEIFNELLSYQKFIIRTPCAEEKQIVSGYDFHTYFEKHLCGESTVLEKKSTTVKTLNSPQFENFEDYARATVWYGRRRGMSFLHGRDITAE